MPIFIEAVEKTYSWGSSSMLQDLTGRGVKGAPLAELWYGAHASSPSKLSGSVNGDLSTLLSERPMEVLGKRSMNHWNGQLPFLLKLLAPSSILSIQVHPDKVQAVEGFKRETSSGISDLLSSRSYVDSNHKPELLYALTDFFAFCGFAPAKTILKRLRLTHRIIFREMESMLSAEGRSDPIRAALSYLYGQDSAYMRRASEAIWESNILVNGLGISDNVVERIFVEHRNDAGLVVLLFMNLVVLRPGEALFVPPRRMHAYVDGLGVEVMANSDNVLRAGLTRKYVDWREALSVVEPAASVPDVLRPTAINSITYFGDLAPEFDLCVVSVNEKRVFVEGRGVRVVLCVGGEVAVWLDHDRMARLRPGDAILVCDSVRRVFVDGQGMIVQVGSGVSSAILRSSLGLPRDTIGPQ